MLPVDEAVVVLITRRGSVEERSCSHGSGRREYMVEYRTDEVLGALAHHWLDDLGGDRGKIKFSEHEAERGREVAERVDHRAVEVDDGRVVAGEIENSCAQSGGRKLTVGQIVPSSSGRKRCSVLTAWPYVAPRAKQGSLIPKRQRRRFPARRSALA